MSNLLLRYFSPFLLVSYTCVVLAIRMIVEGNTGFGLPFIVFLLLFALFFVLLDVVFKKWMINKTKKWLLLEGIIAGLLLTVSLYLASEKKSPEPPKFEVQPVEK